MILSPSLLSADVGNLAAELSALEAAGVQWAHWDVMDGRFVPNITFGQHVIRQMRPRSGLALKHGITLLNTPGTIDADYRGEIGIILVNLSSEPFTVNDGERICQMVIATYAGRNPASGHEGRSGAQSGHAAQRARLRAR